MYKVNTHTRNAQIIQVDLASSWYSSFYQEFWTFLVSGSKRNMFVPQNILLKSFTFSVPPTNFSIFGHMPKDTANKYFLWKNQGSISLFSSFEYLMEQSQSITNLFILLFLSLSTLVYSKYLPCSLDFFLCDIVCVNIMQILYYN